MTDSRSQVPHIVRRRIAATTGTKLKILVGGCALIAALLGLEHLSAIDTFHAELSSHLESAFILTSAANMSMLLVWWTAMFLLGGIPLIVALVLWWIAHRVDR